MNKFLGGNTCFITDLKEEPSKTPGRKPSVFTNEDNKNNTLSSLPTKNCVHEGLASNRVCTYESQNCPVKNEFCNTDGYKRVIRHISTHKEKGIKYHVDSIFARCWVEKTLTMQKRSGRVQDEYLFINIIFK